MGNPTDQSNACYTTTSLGTANLIGRFVFSAGEIHVGGALADYDFLQYVHTYVHISAISLFLLAIAEVKV